MYPNVQLLINNQWRDAVSRKTLDVRNPATEDVIGSVSHAERPDLDLALQAAQAGFEIWRKTSAFDRSKAMRRAANLLRERADEISRLMTLEQGKPLAESKLEVLAAADTIDWFAEESRRAYGRIVPSRWENVSNLVLSEPVGPVAAFTPWNFPINQAVRKVSAGLAAGCSIILKGPEETPASPAALVRAFVDAGIPPGVIGLIYGAPSQISEYLIPHPIIRKISFTGSTAVGKHLASLAGLHMKRATMELGGHAPAIVFDDADIAQAVNLLAVAKFRNAGQVCISPTRFLVQSRVFEEFVDRFVDKAKTIKVGDGLLEGVQMGPLANERRIPALEAFIKDAVIEGATLRTGGKRVGNKGYFFEPTVLAEAPKSSRIMNEEPFGPVAVVNRFDSLAEALSEANRIPYGLASYAFTRSASVAAELASGVEAGMLSINHLGLAIPELPFGGVKDSGYGSEGGSEAMKAYLNFKLVTHAAC